MIESTARTERLNKPYMNDPRAKMRRIMADLDELLSANSDMLTNLRAPDEKNELKDQESITHSETLGTPVLVDFWMNTDPAKGSRQLYCRVGERFSEWGSYVAPAQYTAPNLDQTTSEMVQDGQNVTSRQPFSDGPLIVFRYRNKYVYNALVTSAIDIDAQEILIGNQSRETGQIIAQKMLPQALEIDPSRSVQNQRLVLQVGQEFNYSTFDFASRKQLDNLEVQFAQFSTKGPVQDILVCSPAIPLDPSLHPWIQSLLASTSPLSLDPLFTAFKSNLIQCQDPEQRKALRQQMRETWVKKNKALSIIQQRHAQGLDLIK